MAVDNLSKAPTDGTTFGQGTSDKISFYGVTTISQASAITSPGTTASTTSTPAGYTTTTQADAVVTAVRAIVTALKNIGITA